MGKRSFTEAVIGVRDTRGEQGMVRLNVHLDGGVQVRPGQAHSGLSRKVTAPP
jgi:hypothetical protein